MIQQLQLHDICIDLQLKDVKHTYIKIYPPHGKVVITAPSTTRMEVLRAYAATKLDWIKSKQQQLQTQERETPREFINRESHYLWGKRYLLDVQEHATGANKVIVGHSKITLRVKANTNQQSRAKIIHNWHKALLHEVIPRFIAEWMTKLEVIVKGYFLRKMKTRWGSCNHQAQCIRLNTELVKKPKYLLNYVIAHEMIHLIEPTHNKNFFKLLTTHYPNWQTAKAELNQLPLVAETWD